MKNLYIVNTAVFTSVAALHAMRLVYQLPVSVGSMSIELWLSGVAMIGTFVLALLNWKQVKKHTRTDWFVLLFSLIVVDTFMVLYAWVAGLAFWGISGDTWFWFVLLDLALMAIVHGAIRSQTPQKAK